MFEPPLIYGTAWKEDDTARCVRDALRAGFRAIDTANQRKHYYEAGVGQALAEAYDGGLAREQLWLQTKFTYQRGQDERLPYDPAAPLATQVAQSFARSQEHLGTERLDSLLLHGPSSREGWTDADREVWSAMEALHDAGQVAALGVSNVGVAHLEALVAEARVAPTFVQNRCYASKGWDRGVRALCREHDLTYQGFSLLTANRAALRDPRVVGIARGHGCTIPQVVFRFARQLGMLPLTGTTDPAHMAEDLALDFALSDAEVATLEGIAG